MSQINYNEHQDIQLYPEMMTFKKYCNTTIVPHLTNGWGWFVDIESNSEQIKHRQNNYFTQNVSMLKTIKEYPSIRSMKSMKNLHDTSLMFQIDEDVDKKYRENNICSIMIGHIVGIISLFICFYIIIRF